jgi:hypothetical protein
VLARFSNPLKISLPLFFLRFLSILFSSSIAFSLQSLAIIPFPIFLDIFCPWPKDAPALEKMQWSAALLLCPLRFWLLFTQQILRTRSSSHSRCPRMGCGNVGRNLRNQAGGAPFPPAHIAIARECPELRKVGMHQRFIA